jgi:hypothetical protein
MGDNERKRRIHQYLPTCGSSCGVMGEIIARPEADNE